MSSASSNGGMSSLGVFGRLWASTRPRCTSLQSDGEKSVGGPVRDRLEISLQKAAVLWVVPA